MRIVAGVDDEIVQTLKYRENLIQKWFKQMNCGGQTVLLIAQVSPSPLEISLSSSGALSPLGTTFIDKLTVNAADISLVGRWNFALQYKQNPGQGSTGKDGAEHLM